MAMPAVSAVVASPAVMLPLVRGTALGLDGALAAAGTACVACTDGGSASDAYEMTGLT